MNYGQKRAVVSLIATLFISIPYIVITLIKSRDGSVSEGDIYKFWASAILGLIVVRIIAEIVLEIIAAIITAIVTQDKNLKEEITDERDKLIELKSIRNSHYVLIACFSAAIIAFVVGIQASTIFIVLIFSMVIVEISEHISKLFYYKRGF